MRSSTKWPPLIGGLAVMLIVFAVVFAAVNGARQQTDLIDLWQTERADNQRQRAVLIRGQRDLQVRIDELAQQNTELVELLREQGIDVPASLVTRTRSTTTRVERDSDSDDSDDGDSRSPSTGGGQTAAPRPPSSSPPSRPIEIPDVPDVPVVPDLEIPELPLP